MHKVWTSSLNKTNGKTPNRIFEFMICGGSRVRVKRYILQLKSSYGDGSHHKLLSSVASKVDLLARHNCLTSFRYSSVVPG